MKLKKWISLTFVFLLGILFSNTVFANSVSIYRLYNTVSGEHLYTSDQNEYQTLSNGRDWNGEGKAWAAPDSGTAVYRLYNSALADHLYTTDQNEVIVLTTQAGWQADNEGSPLFYSGGTVPIYRLYHQGTLRHLLTKDDNEYSVLGNSGWDKEGVKLYALNEESNQPINPDQSNNPSENNPGTEKPEENPEPDLTLDIPNSRLVVGDNTKVTAVFKNTSPETISWRSTNPAVASVDSEGNVKALSTGLTWIFATTQSGLSADIPITVIQGENISGYTGINFGPRDKNTNMPTYNIRVSRENLGKVKLDWNKVMEEAYRYLSTSPAIYISKTPNPKAEDYYSLTDYKNQCEKIFTFYSDEPGIASYDPASKSFTINGYGNVLITLGIVGDPSVLSIRNVPSDFAGILTIRVSE